MLQFLKTLTLWLGGAIRSKDGSLSLTKLGATTFHAGMAFHVNWLQWHSATFLMDAWLLYASFAVGHASLDKGAAMVKDYKERTAQPSATRAEISGIAATIGTPPPQG